MNKTININIGGLSFHIDDTAFQKLERYLKAIENSISSQGKEEIMKDIEMRIAEIFTENIPSNQHVVSLEVVDIMIGIMGQPEDYKLEDEPGQTYAKTTIRNKKLYRDIDKNILGGVAAGLGHFFNIDALWIRLLLVLIVIAGFGSPILVYILLWVLIPKAMTTSEKIEMRGEAVNLTTIEKKVMEDLNNPVQADAIIQRNNASNNFSNFLQAFFNVIAKVIGIFITVFSLIMLLGVFIAFIASLFGLTSILNNPASDFVELLMYDSIPVWVISVLGFLAFGIPLFFLSLLGLKLMIPNMKSTGSIVKYTSIAIWIIAVSFLTYFGIRQGQEFMYTGNKIEKIELPISTNDTLKVKFSYNDNYTKGWDDWDNDFKIVQDSTGVKKAYFEEVEIEFLPSENPVAYLQIRKSSKGNSLENATNRAEQIQFNYSITNNELVFDNYFLAELKDKFRAQAIIIYLYLPKNQLVKIDKNVKNFNRTDSRILDLWGITEQTHTFKVTSSQLECLTCGKYLEVKNDTIESISVQINNKEVIKAEPKKGRLVIDKNGTVQKN